MGTMYTRYIHPHPNNPRESLGDLTELIGSIKTHGIMQNLTIVPDEDCTADNPSYTVVIGHRRLQAAKEAGLEEVPVTIAKDLNDQDIHELMLVENMQRKDLTPLEEAKGIQMCLDLGITENRLAEKTGLSKQTIKSRRKLLKYDEKSVKKGLERGATLFDFEEVDKIKDEATRNKLINTYIGTRDFDYQLRIALDEQKKKDAIDKLKKELNKWATEAKENDEFRDMDEVFEIFNNPVNIKVEEIQKPECASPDDKFFYVIRNWSLEVRGNLENPEDYHKTDNDYDEDYEENNNEKSEWEIAKEARKNITYKFEVAYYTRIKFAKEMQFWQPYDKGETENELFKNYVLQTVDNNYIDHDILKDMFGKSFEVIDDEDYSEEKECVKWILDSFKNNKPYILFLLNYILLENINNTCVTWNGTYRENEDVKDLYEFLRKYGYEMSSEEIELVTGTHPDYLKKDED